MRSWKRYPKYKDSGVEWLGEIPEEWKVMRIASFSSKITNGYVGPTREILVECGVKYIQSLYIKNNKIVFDNKYFVSEEWSKQHNNSILHEDDVLVVQTGDIGQVAVVPEEFTGANCHALIIIQTIKNHILGRYLSLILNSDYGYHSLKSIQTGALHPHLNCTFVREINIPTPPLPEQTAIASFLDRETTRIDALIEKKQRQIELLQEKRAALISQAVTKGLDPTVPMRDSGVPWLGEVPEHWAYQPMGYIISIQPGYSFNSDDYSETGIRLLKISNVAFGVVAWDDLTYLPFEYISKYQLFSLNDGDIVMAMTRPVISGGIKVSIVSADDIPSLLNQRVCRLVAGTNISSKFLYYTLISSTFVSYISELLFSTNQPNLSADEIKKFKCLLPSINEQTKIVQFLDKELRSITQIVDLINLSILTLQEYRSALISAAVTGKIDVRNEATA